MLLLSIALHGLLLAIPISIFSQTKSQQPKTGAEKDTNARASVSTSTPLFSEAKMLVPPKSLTQEIPKAIALLNQVPPPPPAGLTSTQDTHPTTTTAPSETPPTPELSTQTSPTQAIHPSISSKKPKLAFKPKAIQTPLIAETKATQTSPTPETEVQISPTPETETTQIQLASTSVFQSMTSNSEPPKQVTLMLLAHKQLLNSLKNPLLKNGEEQSFDTTFILLDEELSLTADLNFAEPDKFALSIPGVQNLFGTAIGKTPDELAVMIKSKLEKQGFQASQTSIYGGGPLYQVKKGTFIQYINLAPIKEGTGAIIVT